MGEIEYLFEWDENKNKINMLKHGVSFTEAQTVFDDPNGLYFPDEQHSIEEDRFKLIGYSEKYRVLFVCYCYRNVDRIRLISARRATRAETNLYNSQGV